jgi:hypothetical protein
MANTEHKTTANKSEKSKTSGPSVTVKTAAAKSKTVKAAPKTAVKSKKAKEPKVKKPKMVRDSFTFPKTEYISLAALKLRAEKLAHPVKKTELLRAGILALTQMTDKSFLESLSTIPAIKTGRPKKE